MQVAELRVHRSMLGMASACHSIMDLCTCLTSVSKCTQVMPIKLQMLPDVVMVKMYPKYVCVLRSANVDQVVTVTNYTALFLDFFRQLVIPPSLHLTLFL